MRHCGIEPNHDREGVDRQIRESVDVRLLSSQISNLRSRISKHFSADRAQRAAAQPTSRSVSSSTVITTSARSRYSASRSASSVPISPPACRRRSARAAGRRRSSRDGRAGCQPRRAGRRPPRRRAPTPVESARRRRERWGVPPPRAMTLEPFLIARRSASVSAWRKAGSPILFDGLSRRGAPEPAGGDCVEIDERASGPLGDRRAER